MPGAARASIDFFAAQAAARRRTAALVVLFALAWAGTIALVHAALVVLLTAGGWLPLVRGPHHLFPFVAAAVTLVTLGGAAFHGLRLAADGAHGVARLLGGVAVDRRTRDAADRRLVNVVEEMAIAAGLPVPAIYVLPSEDGINAFAAGFTPDRAVVAVTRGARDRLTRDELQGVVAHELSHVLNGDARLSLQLVAAVGGLAALAGVGRFLLRDLGDRRLGRGWPALVAVGVCLWGAGSIGALCGKLVRLAVSRQRELLADAAAVQFTRNPDGLASALQKIAAEGSALRSAFAPETAHLFFANGLASAWLSTHPPIAERIRRLVPHGLARRPGAVEAAAVRGAGLAAAAAVSAPSSAAPPGSAPAPSAALAEARALLARLPAPVAAAARATDGAAALACALLLDPEPTVRAVQLAALRPSDTARGAAAAALADGLAGAGRAERMALLDVALPALDGLGREEGAALVRALATLAGADGHTTVFEWAVRRIVERRLARGRGRGLPGRAGARVRSADDVQLEALELLSAVAWLGTADAAAAAAAVGAGVAALGLAGRYRPLPREAVRASRLDGALARLDAAPPALKARLVAACAAAAEADGRIAPAEAEVVRVVAASLGCPLPRLAPAADAAAAGAA